MNTTFAEQLKRLLKDRKIQQKDLAQAINVSKNLITEYVTGRCKPSYETLKAMADYFKITTDDLLGREMEVELNEDAKFDKEGLKKEISDIIDSISDTTDKLKDLRKRV